MTSSPVAEPLPAEVADAARAAAAASVERAELRPLPGGGLGWLESLPQSGSVVLMVWTGGRRVALTPARLSPRSRVHEYGGGSWCPGATGAWLVNEADQGIYLQPWTGGPPLLWWRLAHCRYGDLCLDPLGRWLVAVEEDHSCPRGVVNRLVALGLETCTRQVLAEGEDFYAAPAFAPQGQALVFLSWCHPWQPWNASRLWRLELDAEGLPGPVVRLLDGCDARAPQALLEPRYDDYGRLWLLSDTSGWWNLYQLGADGLQPALEWPRDMGSPPWQLGTRSYAFLNPGRLACSWLAQGRAHLGVLDPDSGALTSLPTSWGQLQSLVGQGSEVFFLASDERGRGHIQHWTPGAPGYRTRLAAPRLAGIAPVPEGRWCQIPTRKGALLEAIYYPPTASRGRLLVVLHGGPTGRRFQVADSQRAFWQRLGYGILELNYRGSSGLGRAYRQALQGHWGIGDAEDACTAGFHALEAGWAQPGGLGVRGGSAGGYTLLRALQRDAQPFDAAACHYGIGDLQRLARTTHKFESHYLHWLVGDPRSQSARYRERSPLLAGPPISTPVIFFQGAEDAVVPPEQTRRMHEALRAAGVDSQYWLLEGERHGFRREGNRARVLGLEWAFYEKILNPTAAQPGAGRACSGTLMEPGD